MTLARGKKNESDEVIGLSRPNILSERIAQRLELMGVSARSVSIKAGLGADAIRTILDGRSHSPRSHTLAALAREMQTTTAYLLGESDNSNESAHQYGAADHYEAIGAREGANAIRALAKIRAIYDQQTSPTRPLTVMAAMAQIGEVLEGACRRIDPDKNIAQAEEYLKTFGQADLLNRIKVGLKCEGRTQAGLALAIGKHPSIVSKILSGGRNVKVDEVETILTYLEHGN